MLRRVISAAVGPGFVAMAMALLIGLPRGMGAVEIADIFAVLWVVFALIVSWRIRDE